MNYTSNEVLQYVKEEDVKFIRLAFTDDFGNQKNVSVMPSELERVFRYGIAIDASAIAGFGDVAHSDLFLHPDPSTLTVLPWRPEHGKVIRMFCSVSCPDGSQFVSDTRGILIKAIETAKKEGCSFNFGAEMEFYLFRLDENGNPTNIPYDNAGYMDVAPFDRGENVRREICLTLEQMGILPESSHHEEGPGQNEIDFRYSDALTAADNAVTFRSVVQTIAARNGLFADFSAKPLADAPGNGLHINVSVDGGKHEQLMPKVIAGILDKVSEFTLFLNPTEGSYARLGNNKAPRYVSWSNENRSQLIRIPAAVGEYRRAELRSPDAAANPYLAFALLIYAGLYGIKNDLPLPEPANLNLYAADKTTLASFRTLPAGLSDAVNAAELSVFVSECLPAEVIKAYCKRK